MSASLGGPVQARGPGACCSRAVRAAAEARERGAVGRAGAWTGGSRCVPPSRCSERGPSWAPKVAARVCLRSRRVRLCCSPACGRGSRRRGPITLRLFSRGGGGLLATARDAEGRARALGQRQVSGQSPGQPGQGRGMNAGSGQGRNTRRCWAGAPPGARRPPGAPGRGQRGWAGAPGGAGVIAGGKREAPSWKPNLGSAVRASCLDTGWGVMWMGWGFPWGCKLRCRRDTRQARPVRSTVRLSGAVASASAARRSNVTTTPCGSQCWPQPLPHRASWPPRGIGCAFVPNRLQDARRVVATLSSAADSRCGGVRQGGWVAPRGVRHTPRRHS